MTSLTPQALRALMERATKPLPFRTDLRDQSRVDEWNAAVAARRDAESKLETWQSYLPALLARIEELENQAAEAREKALREAAHCARTKYDAPGWNGHYQAAGLDIAASILALPARSLLAGDGE